MQLYLIRHSLTEGNQKAWCYGATDIPLVPEGLSLIEKNKALGIYPAQSGKRLYTSGMLRADETLRAIYGSDVDFEPLPLLREYDFGAFECKSHEELSASDPRYTDWLYGDFENTPTPGGESFGAFKERVYMGFSELIGRGEDAVLVTHGGVISAGMSLWFGEEKGNNAAKHFQWTPDPARGYSVCFEKTEKGAYAPISHGEI